MFCPADKRVYSSRLLGVTPMINTEDLCDAQGVADLVGLRHPNSVHTYLRRYADMPRPVIDLGPGRPRLWLRPQIEAWLTVRSGIGPVAQ
jgi:hypothetical protein